MPGPLLIPGLIAGAGLASNAFNAISQQSVNRQSRQWQEKMYGRQRSDALLDWNAQNAYNTPAAQMARFKEAGLNPHLIYGNGTDATAGAVRSSNAGNWSPSAPEVSIDAKSPLMSYYDVQMRDAQISNMHADHAVKLQQALLLSAQTQSTNTNIGKIAQDILASQFDLSQRMRLADTSAEAARANVNKLNAETKMSLDENERRAAMQAPTLTKALEEIISMRVQRTKTRSEIGVLNATLDNLKKDGTLKQLEINLREKGINPNDNIFLRVLARVIDQYFPEGVTGKGVNNKVNELIRDKLLKGWGKPE